MKWFLDTNVWIDLLAERHPYYLPAATLFTYADEGKCKLAVSSLTMVNANFICCDRGKMPLALWNRKVLALSDFVEVCSTTSDDIYNSCRSNWKDYEDGVQFFTAKRNGCDAIVTRNPKDFILSDIEVLTPDQAITKLNSL